MEKKERIEKMIAFIDYVSFMNELLESAFEYLKSVSGELNSKTLSVDSMLDYGKKIIPMREMITEENIRYIELAVLLIFTATLKKYSPDSEEVQRYIEMVMKRHFERYIDQNEEVTKEQCDNVVMALIQNVDVVNEVFESIDAVFNESMCEQLDSEFGKGSSRFIKKAICIYRDNKGEKRNE